MPIVTTTKITRPEHAVEYLAELLNSSSLGLRYIAKYDDSLVPDFPAAHILAGMYQKELHGTHTFAVTFHVDIFVMHGKLTEDRATRNYNDLDLATKVVALLESDLSLGGRVIAGWVETEKPGVQPPRSGRMPAVVSTMLSWRGTIETRF